MPSIALKSVSTCLANCFNVANGISLPLTAKEIVSLMASCLDTTKGSIPVGNDGTRSTAFLTSSSIKSRFSPFSISTVMVPLFSLDVEVTLSIPFKPLRLSSI